MVTQRQDLRRSDAIRADAERYRRRAEDSERWGSEEFGASTAQDFRDHADRLNRAADAVAKKEGRR